MSEGSGDTIAGTREEIAQNAKRSFAKHRLDVIEPGRQWRCWDGTGFYAFRVAVLPGIILIWGDLGTMVVDAGPSYDLGWLRGATKSRNYLLEKCSLEKRVVLMEGEMRAFAKENFNDLETGYADEYEWSEVGWNKAMTAYFERTGNTTERTIKDFDSRAHWCCEALAKFVELLDAPPKKTRKKGDAQQGQDHPRARRQAPRGKDAVRGG